MKRWIGIAFVLGILVGGLGVMRSQQTGTATQRIMQFENDDVKVWKSSWFPMPRCPCTGMSMDA